MPVISAAYEDAFENGTSEFLLRFPNDSSEIDFNKIIEFYEGLARKYTRVELQNKIREYAKKTVDMSVVMKPIIDYIGCKRDSVLKGYYLVPGSDTKYAGVDKKIENQLKIFNKFYNCEKLVLHKEKKSVFKKVLMRLPFGSFCRTYNEALDRISRETGFLYLRQAPFDRKYIDFLKNLRNKCPEAKIIIEIPTYPYDKEYL